jgi:succinate-acetate transporter protein
MLSMILQLGGVVDLISGILTATAVDINGGETTQSKFHFWFQ